MPATTTPVFDLPDRLRGKADPALIGDDEHHFAVLARSLEESIADVSARLALARAEPGGSGQEAMDRDIRIHQLTARLGTLRRYGVDLCLGRMVRSAGAEPEYIGRLGVADRSGRRLLIDWRSPAAEPFFGATHARAMGLASRRRYRWTRGRISDYWDEVFSPDELESRAALASRGALDDQSAFIASLGASRSGRMRDVLGTIAADQDAIIRTGSRGALVVDGGPGTGKTVVALHRAAYLLYSEPRLLRGGGGVLFVGPTPAYLAYVDDVLPSLGEDSVQICTLRDLVAEGSAATIEQDAEVARLKASPVLVEAVATAVGHYERPPSGSMTVETPWADVRLDGDDWAEAFSAADPGATHNDARDDVWNALVDILIDRIDDVPPHLLRRAVHGDDRLTRAFSAAWPVLDPAGVLADLFSVPAYLRATAPSLTTSEVALLQRADARAWTVSDLPLLDAARHRIGDPEAPRRRRRAEAARAAEREVRERVRDELIAADDSEMSVMSMLRGEDFDNSLADPDAASPADPDVLAGPFAHIVVDEAQELTDAEWPMLLRRCPSRSFTIVGDRAQARAGFSESWAARLERAGVSRVSVATLTVNYRTPAEVMAEAEPVIRAVLPDASVPVSVRTSGIPVRHAFTDEMPAILEAWLAANEEGVACVIGDPGFAGTSRVRSLRPDTAKGLEFDLVVLVDPKAFGDGIRGGVDRYVAMTRATQQLVVLTPR